MASPEIENRVTIHKERKLPSVWSLICLIDLRIEPLRSSNICICVSSWHCCFCLTLIILEICIYFNMDQDVGKRAGFLERIIPSYFVVGLVERCSYDACICVQTIWENNASYYVYQIIICTHSIIIHITCIEMSLKWLVWVWWWWILSPDFLKDMFILYNTLEKMGKGFTFLIWCFRCEITNEGQQKILGRLIK